jgi:hypothetical protein
MLFHDAIAARRLVESKTAIGSLKTLQNLDVIVKAAPA